MLSVFSVLVLMTSIFGAAIVFAIEESEGSAGTTGVPSEVLPSGILDGYKIAVVDAGYDPASVEGGLDALGAQADRIPVASITSSLLCDYQLLWIPVQAAGAVDIGGKAGEVLTYVDNGGGLILAQPNELITPQCLPYAWEIVDDFYTEPCATTIVDPTHALTTGLSLNAMPDCFDEVGAVGPEWTILALDANGDPSFACATYGNGKVIVEMDAPYPAGDVCGDAKSLNDNMVGRMVSWVAGSCAPPPPVGGEYVPVNTLTLLAPYLVIIAAAAAGATGILRRKRIT